MINLDKECCTYISIIDDFVSLNQINLNENPIKIELDISNNSIESLKTEISNFGKVYFEESTHNDPVSESNSQCDLNISEESCSALVETNILDSNDIENTFWCPSGVKFNSSVNKIFVADTFNHQIKVIDSENGMILKNFHLNSSNLMRQITPRDIHFNSQGILIITDSSNHRCHF